HPRQEQSRAADYLAGLPGYQLEAGVETARFIPTDMSETSDPTWRVANILTRSNFPPISLASVKIARSRGIGLRPYSNTHNVTPFIPEGVGRGTLRHVMPLYNVHPLFTTCTPCYYQEIFENPNSPVILCPTRESNPRPLARQSYLRPLDQRGSHFLQTRKTVGHILRSKPYRRTLKRVLRKHTHTTSRLLSPKE
ncbi:hypothetical protein SFRURICE_012130, partial [Spodoptera frugiperda]